MQDPQVSTKVDDVLRKVMAKKAKNKCRIETEEFVKCAKEKPISFVFFCRKQNHNMKKCITNKYVFYEFYFFNLISILIVQMKKN